MAKNLTFIVNGRRCYPNYSGDISFTSSRGNDERYFRTNLDSPLTFLDGLGDFSWIRSQAFDTEFKITITSDDGFLWRGVFYKTDCTFDADNHSVTVTPATDDLYKRIIERMDDTIDIIKLAPAATEMGLTKRGILQVYVVNNGNVGDKILTNWLGNMTWEQDVNISEDMSESQMISYLTNHCHFTHADGPAVVRIKGLGEYDGLYSGSRVTNTNGTWRYEGSHGNYVTIVHQKESISGRAQTIMTLFSSSGAVISRNEQTSLTQNDYPYPSLFGYGTYAFYDYYMRWLHDKEDDAGSYRRYIDDDIISYDVNYRFVKEVDATTAIVEFEEALSDEPTEWGRDEFNKYFIKPSGDMRYQYVFPIARSTWSPLSVWLKTTLAALAEDEFNVPYTLKDSYSLPNIIKVLLHEIVPDPINGVAITHEGTPAYSSWLYSPNPMRMPFLAPISNVKKTHYENPAQKGEMSLRQLLDMLRDCFNVYWYIADDGKLCLEHISYFMTDRSVGVNLTAMAAPRNLKRWSEGQNSWSYDKVQLPERIEFEYGEKQTEPFNGCVLQYLSNYVQRGEVEKITIGNFSADVDYITSMTSLISDDGWVLLLPALSDGSYQVPIISFEFEGVLVYVQNGNASRYKLFLDGGQYNMSSPRYKFADVEYSQASSLKRVRKQSVTFPYEGVVDPYSLIRTGLSTTGNDGEIMSITYTPLSDTYKAEINFDTE